MSVWCRCMSNVVETVADFGDVIMSPGWRLLMLFCLVDDVGGPCRLGWSAVSTNVDWRTAWPRRHISINLLSAVSAASCHLLPVYWACAEAASYANQNHAFVWKLQHFKFRLTSVRLGVTTCQRTGRISRIISWRNRRCRLTQMTSAAVCGSIICTVTG